MLEIDFSFWHQTPSMFGGSGDVASFKKAPAENIIIISQRAALRYHPKRMRLSGSLRAE